VLESPIAAAVQDSCKTRFFCPDASAQEKTQDYAAFGLSSREIQLLTEAVPRRDYYVKSPAGSRLFDLRLSPAALSVLGVSGEKALEVWEEWIAGRGARWLEGYLADLGLSTFLPDPHPLSPPLPRGEGEGRKAPLPLGEGFGVRVPPASKTASLPTQIPGETP
jgi:hypothetical protein